MCRLLATLALASLFLCPAAFAEDSKPADFADYGVSVGVSPFGGSLSFIYNESAKTSWLFGLGGLPSDIVEMKVDVDGTEYTTKASSSWVGLFLNHRPFASATWFRLVAGVGFGNIENELDDGAGNTYSVDYKENPVGYLGLGFGAKAVKGFFWGVDVGWLQSAGPQITPTAGDGADVADIADNLFFGSALPNMQLTLGWGF